ncbi:hypothetical protein DXT90_18240 [Agrobacterium tumefaciens]|nr:hypothetical protein [Agrobacterium tumefaciens]
MYHDSTLAFARIAARHKLNREGVTVAEIEKSTGNWHKVGYVRGMEAGCAEMLVRETNFGPIEDALAMGHAS